MLDRKPFYFLRHGQTDWNAERLCQGRIDIPLNAAGVKQAGEAKAHLAGTAITTICSSPLGRALETAKMVNGVLKSRLVIIDELQECSFGEAEGKPINAEPYDAIIRNAGNFGGEPFEAFVARAIAGINQALSHPGPVLIVSHGGIFHAMKSLVRLRYEGDIPNCVPLRLTPSEDEPSGWTMEMVRNISDL
ncbi:MAG: histidine phosphatase family protein [Rhodospirillales bacterium]|nr:histidine phosphatase family protein [Alphaproteobacteria bacterium]MBL6948823.1 histidine phosphatase family protein [Rhodospirillales bacterium]